MPRPEHKHHYIYKTTCSVTNKFYIGMHSTLNLEDGYLGSGKRLRYSIRKYGIENHTIEILEHFSDRKSLAERERELVNESLLKDPMCMNLAIGGEGGFTQEQLSRGGKVSMTAINLKRWQDPAYRKQKRESMQKKWEDPEHRKKMTLVSSKSFLGKSHTEETKKLMKERAQLRTPQQNSQFGTMWICNKKKKESIKIKIENFHLYEQKGWVKGRKVI